MSEKAAGTEKRRGRRRSISMELDVSPLFKQDNVKVEGIGKPIEIVNISETGAGFITESLLPTGYYFNSRIKLPNMDKEKKWFRCIVRIVRCEKLPDGKYMYGCEFVGLAPVLE